MKSKLISTITSIITSILEIFKTLCADIFFNGLYFCKPNPKTPLLSKVIRREINLIRYSQIIRYWAVAGWQGGQTRSHFCVANLSYRLTEFIHHYPSILPILSGLAQNELGLVLGGSFVEERVSCLPITKGGSSD